MGQEDPSIDCQVNLMFTPASYNRAEKVLQNPKGLPFPRPFEQHPRAESVHAECMLTPCVEVGSADPRRTRSRARRSSEAPKSDPRGRPDPGIHRHRCRSDQSHHPQEHHVTYLPLPPPPPWCPPRAPARCARPSANGASGSWPGGSSSCRTRTPSSRLAPPATPPTAPTWRRNRTHHGQRQPAVLRGPGGATARYRPPGARPPPIRGTDDAGRPYSAEDPDVRAWVMVTRYEAMTAMRELSGDPLSPAELGDL